VSVSWRATPLDGLEPLEGVLEDRGQSLFGALRRPGPALGLGVLAAWLLAAALAPLIVSHDPLAPTSAILHSPSGEHWFGTDQLGRDVFSRVVYGARVSLPLALLLVVLSSIIGSLIGAVAGLAGGVIDSIVMRITDMFFAFPGIVLTMAIAAALGPSLRNAVLAVVIVNWPAYARVVRGLMLSIRSTDYITTSRLLGTPMRWVLARDVLPNVIGPIVVLATLDLGSAVLLLAGLSFLGLGAQPPTAEWGAMIAGGAQYFSDWWIALFPGLAIVTVVFAANLIGDAMRDFFDPSTLTRSQV
jgi:ABC-type dipeptide/oligopeptide/nickel transport system permease subunit